MSHYIAPRFLDKVAIHITKNFLPLPKVKVPLILGIHGRKGEGKSYQCELIFEKMGIPAIHMSAGEMESPDAGDPARLIRLRYREAAEFIRVRGQMAVLMINDLDAGAGRLDNTTQYTVNTQLVHGTLMNIADNPTNVQLPGSYDETPLHRVPIIVTGNDFSTLYAPLVRDGRMEKFYWEPDRNDRLGIVGGIFEAHELSPADVEQLVDHFSDQAIDFYSALRARLYDEQVRQFIQQVGLDKISRRVANSVEPLPDFQPPDFRLSHLIEQGERLVKEQQRVAQMRLAEVYSRAEHRPATTSVQSGSIVPPMAFPEPAVTPTLPVDLEPQIGQLLEQGNRFGLEYVDRRRFRANSWQCFSLAEEKTLAGLRAQITGFLAEYPDHYVRLVATHPKSRQRVMEAMIQRPAVG